MPIYEYRCTRCGNDFEEIVGKDDPAPVCPACHSPKTEKLMSKANCRTGSESGYGGGDDGGCGCGGGGCGSSGCAGCSGGSCATCH